ncbi:hypothetical protein [Azotobacter salinestris]|uniref:hypothetical protein n=1 Tax=Azotobacter salinestris TaxID=69964 RepID=UPI0032DE3271
MINPFIVHEGQVYINQALVAEQSKCQAAFSLSEAQARSNADARLAGALDQMARKAAGKKG